MRKNEFFAFCLLGIGAVTTLLLLDSGDNLRTRAVKLSKARAVIAIVDNFNQTVIAANTNNFENFEQKNLFIEDKLLELNQQIRQIYED